MINFYFLVKHNHPLQAGHLGAVGALLHLEAGGGFHDASGGSFSVAICYSGRK